MLRRGGRVWGSGLRREIDSRPEPEIPEGGGWGQLGSGTRTVMQCLGGLGTRLAMAQVQP